MRRLLVLAVAVFAAMPVLAGCSDDSSPQDSAATPPSTSQGAGSTATASAGGPTATASVPPADAAVTAQVCQEAGKAVSDAATFFTQQMAALEKAAADGDQDAVVAAANAIQDRLTALAATVKTYLGQAVSPKLRTVLEEAGNALTEISSEAYAGTQADIKKKLTELVADFQAACA